MEIDDIDREILTVLQIDGRTTWLDLADRIGLGPSAATQRVRRLERTGAITGYGARLDPALVGRPLEARVSVTLRAGLDPAVVADGFAEEPAVVEAVHLTGPEDYELTVRCADTSELDGLLLRLKRDRGAERSETRIVLGWAVPRRPPPLEGSSEGG